MRSGFWAPGPSRWRRVAAVLAAVALAAMVVLYINRLEQRLNCQARYNEANNARTRALTEVAADERAADRAERRARAALFRHPAALTANENRTPEQRSEIAALARIWAQASINQEREGAEADKARAENPVPPPPSVLCDDRSPMPVPTPIRSSVPSTPAPQPSPARSTP